MCSRSCHNYSGVLADVSFVGLAVVVTKFIPICLGSGARYLETNYGSVYA